MLKSIKVIQTSRRSDGRSFDDETSQEGVKRIDCAVLNSGLAPDKLANLLCHVHWSRTNTADEYLELDYWKDGVVKNNYSLMMDETSYSGNSSGGPGFDDKN